jgi:heme/copper-type cytochrome/quinol oxidase subunit 1
MTSGENNSNRPASRKWRALLVPLMAAAATVAGIVVVLTPRRDIGWFAYAPLANETFSSSQLILVDGTARAGYGLIAAGMLALAFWAGYRFALHRSRAARQP